MQANSHNFVIAFFCAVILLCAFLFSADLYAAQTTKTAFDLPLATLRNIISGPVAYTLSLLGIVSAGAMLVFGGEINQFLKSLIMLILVISLIALASQLLSTFFNISAATIAQIHL